MSEESDAMQLGYDRAKYGVNRQDPDAMGERAVRDALNSGKWGHSGLAPFEFVSAWLADKDFVRREQESSAIRDSAASSRSAAASARLAARWAAIIATIGIMIDSKDQIVGLVISWLP